MPVFCGADQSHPKGRLVGEIADSGAFGGAHPLDLLIDIDIDVEAPRSTYRQGATGSAGMICTGSSNCVAESGRQVRMPVNHRVHRIAQAVGVKGTGYGEIQLHRIQIVASPCAVLA